MRFWWWAKRRLLSQNPRRGRGRVLTTQGQGRHQKLSPNFHGFCWLAHLKNRPKTAKEDLGKRLPRATGRAAALTKSREFPPGGSAESARRGGVCRPGLTFVNCVADGRKCLSKPNLSLSTGAGRWPWDHLTGVQCPTLSPEGWLQQTFRRQSSKGIFSLRDYAGIWHECQQT